MTAIDRLVRHAQDSATSYDRADLPHRPSERLTVVACMDARLDVYDLLGLEPGQAHVLRNAGGVVTQDVLRSLAISQRLLGSTDVMLIHHTGCGMLTFTDDEFRATIERETGTKPFWSAEAFTDLATDVRQSMARVVAEPAIPSRTCVRGFIWDVSDGSLREVLPVGAPALPRQASSSPQLSPA